jgi:hypothetical protein
MRDDLYAFELEGLVDHLKASMAQDQDDYIFAVIEHNGDVALVLVEQSGDVHRNEQARTKLQALWPAAYARNLQRLIPAFAQQLHAGDIPINGVKTVRSTV